MKIYKCLSKCCNIYISEYKHVKDSNEKFRNRRKKAGFFIYDPESKKILLVQSRGHLWGPPKGTKNLDETELECAIRELKEETGYEIQNKKITKYINICNRAIYFYMEMKEEKVQIQKNVYGNDANGVCWIKLDCLEKCILNGNISITQHCRIALSKFCNKYMPFSNFEKVKRKKIKYKNKYKSRRKNKKQINKKL